MLLVKDKSSMVMCLLKPGFQHQWSTEREIGKQEVGFGDSDATFFFNIFMSIFFYCSLFYCSFFHPLKMPTET